MPKIVLSKAVRYLLINPETTNAPQYKIKSPNAIVVSFMEYCLTD